MAQYKIYNRGSDPSKISPKAVVSKLTYSGTWMQECSLTVTVNSPVPIEFLTGDFIDYRGERFWIDLVPGVKKQARWDYSGEGFVYENLMFYNAIRELKLCDFLDYVESSEGVYTYSAASSVVFFAATVEDFANRISANLGRLYTGDDAWTVVVDDNIKDSTKTFDGAGNQIIRDKTVSISNSKIYDVLSEIKEQFGTTYTIRGREIKIGFAPDVVGASSDGDAFEYYDENNEKRMGLVSLERTVNTQSSVITRLRAYGSERNLPTRYYANKYMKVRVDGNYIQAGYLIGKTERTIDITRNTVNTGLDYMSVYKNYFIKTDVAVFECDLADPGYYHPIDATTGQKAYYSASWKTAESYGGRFINHTNRYYQITLYNPVTNYSLDLNGLAFFWRPVDSSDPEASANARVWYMGFYIANNSDTVKEAYIEQFVDSSSASSADASQRPTLTFRSGVYPDAWDSEFHYYDDMSGLALSIVNLMLPGFPSKSLQDYVYGEYGTGRGNVALQEWIKECYGSASALDGYLSTDKFFPYIDSPYKDDYGVRESNVYFTEDSDDFDEVYPSIENGYNGSEVNYFVMVDKTGATIPNSGGFDDNGVFSDETVSPVGVQVPYAGFDWVDVWNDEMTISMTSGMCAGREFKVSRAVNVDGVATNGAYLYLERAFDESTQLYYPYIDYPLTGSTDGDKWVVLNIEMPDSYVTSAAEKVFKQAVLYLSQHDRPSFIYTPVLSSVYVQRERDARIAEGKEAESVWYKIKEGSALLFNDDDLTEGVEEQKIIKTLSIKEGEGMIPTFEVTMQEDEPKTKLSALEKQVNSLTKSSGSNVVGGTTTQNATRRKLSTKLDYAWFQKLFKAVDADGNEVKPNSEADIDHLELQVNVKGKDASGNTQTIYKM
jgi:hypothetical protein